MESPKIQKSVNVSEAQNGYVVSMYGDKGETKVVCKDMAEVHKAVEKMLGGKGQYVSRIGKKSSV